MQRHLRGSLFFGSRFIEGKLAEECKKSCKMFKNTE